MTLPDDWTDEIQAYADSVYNHARVFGVRRLCADAFAYTVVKLRDRGFTEEPVTRVTTPLLSLTTESHEQVWRVVRSILRIAATVQAHQGRAAGGGDDSAVLSYAAQIEAAEA